MTTRNIIFLMLLAVSTASMADSHTDVALDHVKATDLKNTFSISRDMLLEQLNQYESKLLSLPAIKGNPNAVNLAKDYISTAKIVAEDIYTWETVEAKFVEALKETYTEEELKQINLWLASKYGQVFIAKQKKFMLRTIDINNYAGQMFKQRITPIEIDFLEKISNLTK
ncbi:DUF2059 domain-containing protein [Leptospira sp. 96542]|nr:DUF2059 domain-containing protein [Leptospira sp. 96542]